MNDIIRVVGIFGTGGSGKTTISNDIYNRISSQFERSCFLKDVRETSKQTGGLIKLQNRLLFDILGTCLDIHDVDRGINVIRHRLSSKRVLLILDDVDELVQIEKLAGDRDWFGSGSRILITTRDQHLLEVFEVDSKYKVKILDENEALRLFSLHAFKKEPLEGYVELSKQVTKYAQGVYEYDATLFPENQIPEWFSYVHEFLKDNDDGRRRKKEEEWVIDIEGPHYLEEISGIVLYLVKFVKDAERWRRDIGCNAEITTNGSNHSISSHLEPLKASSTEALPRCAHTETAEEDVSAPLSAARSLCFP
ncbi:hypothetical protein F2P56_013530, partial [Juglans regia]